MVDVEEVMVAAVVVVVDGNVVAVLASCVNNVDTTEVRTERASRFSDMTRLAI